MQNHSNISDDNFEQLFKNCDLDPSVFSHEAHLRLAWIHLDKYGLEKAIVNIDQQLQSFVAHVGASDKYHKTLTIAAIKTVNHFKKKTTSKTFKDFIEEFPQLNSAFKDLIRQHYSFDIYNSTLAKTEFIEPDLTPYDKD